MAITEKNSLQPKATGSERQAIGTDLSTDTGRGRQDRLPLLPGLSSYGLIMMQVALDLMARGHFLESRGLLPALGHHMPAPAGKDTAFRRIDRTGNITFKDNPFPLNIYLRDGYS